MTQTATNQNRLRTSAERSAEARSLAYATFVDCFEYPDDELYAAIRSGALAVRLREVLAGVDPSLLEGANGKALADAGRGDELAVEFTRLFDVGTSGPPCPLYGGLYSGARMKTMEEAVRFYNHFGLSLSETIHELPDHLTTELEFLHFLAFREAECLARGTDPGPFQRAQRDFVARHPGRWVPQLRRRLERNQPMPFFLELVRRLETLLAYHAADFPQEEGNLNSLRS